METKMKYKQIITTLTICIMIAAGIASGIGVFSHNGPGPYQYESIRGQSVAIYGYGIYQQMSADVAIQGIAQDYITLFLAVPILGIALILSRRGSLRAQLFLTGVLGYFLVTYLFYMIMGMYNVLFLVYAFLLGCSFFSLLLSMFSLHQVGLTASFSTRVPIRFCGVFLMINACSIAFLWLGVVVPPLLDGTIYPIALEHYTTLIVQGMDLGLLLPLSIVSGLLMYRKSEMGYLYGPVYLIFLAFLMTALTAKIIAMGLAGISIIPVVFIIPTITIITITLVIQILRSIQPTA